MQLPIILMLLQIVSQRDPPPRNLTREATAAHFANRLRGGLLILQIRPEMREEKVRAILGETSLFTGSLGSSQWSYRDLSVHVSWSYSLRIYAPSERLGPQNMAIIRAVPSRWVQLAVVPLLSATYMEPSVLQEVAWCGLAVYRNKK
jgi:hypothetical protein